MKYWNHLNSLESEIIRVDSLKSLFTVIANGIETSNVEDIESALQYVEGSLQDINARLRESFDELWEAVRVEEWQETEDEDVDNQEWHTPEWETPTPLGPIGSEDIHSSYYFDKERNK